MTSPGCSVHVRAADAGLVVCLQPGLAQPQDTAEAAELCGVMMCYSGNFIKSWLVPVETNTDIRQMQK